MEDDFITVACNCDETVLPSYSNKVCTFVKARIIGVFVTACGVTVSCIQDETEVQGLIDNNQAQYIKGTATRPNDTPNTATNRFFPCGGPETIVLDYGASLDFEASWSFDNHEFWENLRQNATIGELYYVRESGYIFKANGSVEVSVNGYTEDENILGVTGSANWTTTSLDTPYLALSTIFGCSA